MKRSIALLLALVLALSCAPIHVWAQELTEETTVDETTVATEATEETAEETTIPQETVPVETMTAEETTSAQTESVIEENIAAEAHAAASGTPDGTPPVLNDIILSADTVTAPGTIEVIVDASDDVSGVTHGYVNFYCEDTEKELYVNVNNTYWSNETHQEEVYADGKLHGTLEVDQYVETGSFVIRSVELRDNAENYMYYYLGHESHPNAPSNYADIPDHLKIVQFSVVDVVTADSTPPTLNNITLSINSVAAPSTIDVTVDASDDVSGVTHGYVNFYCEDTEKELYVNVNNTYWSNETHQEEVYADGKLHGTLEIDQYVETGSFVIRSVELRDNAENYMYYYLGHESHPNAPSNYADIPDHLKIVQFSVMQSATPDGTPPVLNNIILSPNTVTAPGYIEVIVDASDDVSGVTHGYVNFYCEDTEKELYVNVNNTYWSNETHQEEAYADGKLHGTLEVDQYVETGSFVIRSVELRDNAENYMYYYLGHESHPNAPSNYADIPVHLTPLTLTVRNSDADVTTSVNKSDFVETVQNADNDAYIIADYSGEAILTKDTFEAIAGTDKTLDLVSEGITWRFEGSDIVNEVNPIDLHVDIQPVEETQTGSGTEIQKNLMDNPGVVMKFAENGQLPGKATIQVKVDYAMQQYLGSSQYLNVYYFNNETGKLELIAKDLQVNGESYVEFPITHCSYYVLTGHVDAGFDAISMYRLYNPNSGEHFYTGSLEERNLLISAGWNYEGVAWNAPIHEGDPVHRVYNPNSGDHHYTMSREEIDMLVDIGWQYEGVAWNSAGDVPQHRLYNPNADCGSHHYTSSIEERDYLVSLGWKYEGIGWYGMLN